MNDFADEDTDPGCLPACTIVGPLLIPREPARLPYHLRYPPQIDEPVHVVLCPNTPDAADDFGDEEDDTGERLAIGSRPIGDDK